MRIIKFRIWNKKEKKMFYEPYSMYKITKINDVFKSKKYHEWMQFIGLKDKKGKEIYEGDVLKRDKRKKRASIVKFSGGMFLFSMINEPYFDYPSAADKFEIIGNIYENKELLK